MVRPAGRRDRPSAGAVSATLFALAHGTQDAWLFGDRLAFGLVASWLAWRTGGLEAPIALHVANNLVSLAFTAATGSLEDSLTASTLEWQFAVAGRGDDARLRVRSTVSLVGGGWSYAVSCRPPSVPTAGGPGVLSGPDAVGYPGARPSTPPPAGSRDPLGYGVIGSPADSGSVSLGSSPGTPAGWSGGAVR